MAAYRRRHHTNTITSSTVRPSISIPTPYYSYEEDENDEVDRSNPTSLAAKAIRASSSHRDSSLSSAYAVNHPSPSSSPSSIPPTSVSSTSSSSSSYSSKDSKPYQYTSMKTLNESKQGFWGSLARKAKSILEDDNAPQDSPPTKPKYHYDQNPYPSRETQRKTDSPTLQKGLNAISSSLNYIGNAVEEGLTVVENRTADIIQETRKHIKKKPDGAAAQNEASNRTSMRQQPQMQTHRQPQMETEKELQLKASRDVAMAMAAKAKLLLRELKTVKADLAFAKERCAQLEEENKILRENRERGENLEDDDLIRLQLETLLAEKARLAHENSIYARENRFLREVVEYHQLTMQDVVYLDEGTEEVTEVYPVKVVSNTHSTSATSLSPLLHTDSSLDTNLSVNRDILPHPVPPPGLVELSQSAAQPSSYTPTSNGVDTKAYSTLV